MAKKDVVKWGFTLEGTITGKWSKMLSYGDMEANYQGLKLFRRLCGEKKSYLKKEDNFWVIKNDILCMLERRIIVVKY